MTLRSNRSYGAILAMSAMSLSGAASGGSFYIQEQSAAGVGRAQAGNVVAADDASTIYFNPAGLSELEGIQAAGGIDLIVPDSGLTNNGSVNRSTGAFLAHPSSGGFVPASGGNGGNPGSASPVPDFYVSYQMPDSPLTFGLGVSSPFGFASKYAQDSFARYDSIDSFIETVDIAPTVAWKINEWLSIGAGLDEQYTYIKLRQALPNPLTIGGPVPSTDGRLTLTGHTWSTGFNMGILLKPTPDTKIGFSYRYGITHNIDKGSVTFSGLTGPLAARNGNVGASAQLDLPDIVSVGIAQKISPELTLLGEVDYYSWSNFKQIAVHLFDNSGDLITPENYKDTFSVALGGEYQLTDQVKLRAGVKFDQTPTIDAFRDTRVPDGDRYWLAGGLHYQISENLGLDGSYAHIFVDDSNININRPFYSTAPFPIPTSSTIKATSTVSLDILTVGFTYRF
ncbi:MAG: rane protein involved in aromatic hydrocarbon degradation [Rhodospirillales bacterium]|nr:rane protein involved in aromatic hydrocarbon degradation [Rhodospirillales bacterium]